MDYGGGGEGKLGTFPRFVDWEDGMQEVDQFKEERFIFRHAELRCQWSTQMEICDG